MEGSSAQLRTICKIADKLGYLTLRPYGLILFNWKWSQKGSDSVIKMGEVTKDRNPER